VLAIGIGDGPATMGRALGIAEVASGADGWPVIWASAGIHPQEAASADAEALVQLASLARHVRCVVIGEIGLDYYHVENPAVEVQREAFVAQMRIAAEARKPIVIHCRTSELATAEAKKRFGAADAWEDVLELIGEHWAATGLGGIMHCFSGGVEEARRSLELGFYLSFAGNLTYPKAVAIREAATFAPADRILVETDAPFLAPIPHRGSRNEPALMVHTAQALAALRGISPEALAQLTSTNFQRLFPATCI
jgi:TatD DNase family protein